VRWCCWANSKSTAVRTKQPSPHGRRFRAKIEERPGDQETILALARYLGSRGDADLARIELKRLLDRSPANLEARLVLGRGLLAAGREEDIVSEYATLLDLLEASILATSQPSAPEGSTNAEEFE
jgi:cytochrome c-type biogenesis protein CcmH/NrfG